MTGNLRRYARVLTGAHPRTQGWPLALGLWLRPALTLALRTAESWRAVVLRPRLHCSPTNFEDPAIDALWARRPDDLLLGERSAGMLRWRFGRAGRGDWSICLARRPDGEAAGFLVWRLNGGTAEVGDFYTTDPSRTTAAMLNAFYRFARTQAAHSVSLEFFGSGAIAAQIARAGFRPRDEDAIVVLAAAANSAPELADTEWWYLTAFDNDAS